MMCRQPFIRYISDEEHYNEVLTLLTSVSSSLLIATADIKDLYVRRGDTAVSFVAILDILLRNGVEVCLLHAKTPGQNLSNELKNYPSVWDKVRHKLCNRVHFKMMIFDDSLAYIGSANLTGAGIGMKNISRRNFECGILTDAPLLVSAAHEHFKRVFTGLYCPACGRKSYCKVPISKTQCIHEG